MSKPTRAAIIAAAAAMLRGGTLPSALPGRLMDDYSLTPTEARELAGAAVKRWKAEKPPAGAGNGGKQKPKE